MQLVGDNTTTTLLPTPNLTPQQTLRFREVRRASEGATPRPMTGKGVGIFLERDKESTKWRDMSQGLVQSAEDLWKEVTKKWEKRTKEISLAL